ncbi:MAG: hypothetical protein U0796_18595 [Gemmatales bacterium]
MHSSLRWAIAFILLNGACSWAQDDTKPATVQQIKAAIDWAKVPKLEGATKVQTYFNHMMYKAPGTYQQAADFYRKMMPTLGWNEDASLKANKDQSTYLYVPFEKDGQLLTLTGYRGKPEEPMSLTLMIFGNVNVGAFPKMADAKLVTSNRNVVFYNSPSKPEDVVSFARKFMEERGWKEFPDDMAATWAKEGRHVMKFRQAAMEVTIVVATMKNGPTQVNYSASVQHQIDAAEVKAHFTPKELPAPTTLADAVKLLDISKLPRMDKAEKFKYQKELYALPIGTSYRVPASSDEAAAFYRKLLSEQGWTELPPGMEMEKMARLYFEKAGYLLGLSVVRQDRDNLTDVNLLHYGNVDVRQLPYPPGVRFQTNRNEFVNGDTTLSIDDAMAFFKTEFGKLGWKEEPVRGKGVIRFKQNAMELDVEVTQNIYKKTAIKVRQTLK